MPAHRKLQPYLVFVSCSIFFLLLCISTTSHTRRGEMVQLWVKISEVLLCQISLPANLTVLRHYCYSTQIFNHFHSSFCRFWCLLQLENWLSKFNRLHMTMGSVPVSKAPVSMVELLKGRRFETLKGVGTVLNWMQIQCFESKTSK